VCAYKSYPYNAIIVIHSDNNPIVVSFDVKNYAVVVEEACGRIIPLYVSSSLPFGILRFLVPAFQLLFTIRMLGPKQAKCTFCNNSHGSKIAQLFP
jgi:hypothetical protein